MDIHRCRFVDYAPPQIHALAFSHPPPATPSSTPLPHSLRLAIGRSNGSIEIWNPTTWFHESTLHGGRGRSIEGLAWIRQYHYSVKGTDLLRLFSIGNSTLVTEWDLVSGRPLAHFDCGKGVVWSIAAQPRSSWFADRGVGEKKKSTATAQPNGQSVDDDEDDGTDGMQLVVGCEDGSLVVISTEGGPGDMRLVKVIPQSKPCRILSLAYQSSNVVVAGTSDSKLRAFDLTTGRVLSTMSVGPKINNPKQRNAKKKDTYVWTVKCIPGSDGGWIVAGDSRGEISLYDGKRYYLRQKIKSHNADVLTIETNAIGTQIFSSGVDQATIKYELVGSGKRATWTQVGKRRFHKHDVRAMAGYEGGKLSVLVSGGVDMTPIVMPLRCFGEENQRTLSALPQSEVCATAPAARLLIAQFDREVKIWRMNTIDEVEAADDLELYGAHDDDQGRKLVGGIQINTEENISASTISPAGNLLAISTLSTTKLFHLRPSRKSSLLRISKLELPAKLSALGARKIAFSPDGRYLALITHSSEPYIIRILSKTNEEGKQTFEFHHLQHLDRKDREVTLLPGSGNNRISRKDGVIALGKGYERQINILTFSPDGKSFYASDLGGWQEVWSFNEEKGKWKLLKSSLPRILSPAVAAGFKPSNVPGETDKEVFVITAEHKVHEFDVVSGGMTGWSRRNDGRLPVEFRGVLERCCGLRVLDEGVKGRRAWMWGHGWVFMVNLERDLNIVRKGGLITVPEDAGKGGEEGALVKIGDGAGTKRKRGVVMGSGAGGPVRKDDRGVTRGSSVVVVGKKIEEDDDEVEDVDSDDEFLVNVAKSDRQAERGIGVEMVKSDSEEEESSDEEEDEESSDSSSSDSSSEGDSEEDSDDDEEKEAGASDSEMSVTEHPTATPAFEQAGALVKMDVDGGAGKQVVKLDEQLTPYWLTFEYRNVMGFLPIGNPQEDLEMLIVERPLGDVKLPPAWAPKKGARRVERFLKL